MLLIVPEIVMIACEAKKTRRHSGGNFKRRTVPEGCTRSRRCSMVIASMQRSVAVRSLDWKAILGMLVGDHVFSEKASRAAMYLTLTK